MTPIRLLEIEITHNSSCPHCHGSGVAEMTRRQDIRLTCDILARAAAQRIGASAWYDHGKDVLTPAEQAEVRALWDSMPGSTCWMDAFLDWMNREP